MTAIDVANDPGFGLRTEVTPEQLSRAAREYEARREKNARVEMGVFTVTAALMCTGAIWLYRRRSRVLAAADNSAIAAAASGLKATRKLRSAYDRFVARVRERAGPPVDKDLGG
jgi:hypothetical protein